MKNRGFTLIEILIALTVFAIIASITSSTLYYAFNTRTRVNAQSERLSTLQLTVSLLQQDIYQVVDRAVRGNEMRLFPVFIGQADYLEFTRDGDINPLSKDKRSTLKRVAFVCEKGALLRRTWDTLDTPERNTYVDKLLIDNLSDCHFAFLNQSLQSFPEWRTDAVGPTQNKEALPKAIQVNLNLADLGEINLLFTIPGGLYGVN